MEEYSAVFEWYIIIILKTWNDNKKIKLWNIFRVDS